MGWLALVHVVVVVLLAGFTLGAAVSFAWRPGERKLAALRPLSLALVLAVLSSTFAGIALTTKHAADAGGLAGDGVPQLLAGIAEAMVLGILGFTVLALSWALVAVGFRRQD